ncbi:DUF1249 domain-containing protein [Aliidiomarina quisquiliarum]|uniref:DUF1249 domain-containing protein n=1 Tax=Aliidiomarina quisquiliarum TaxID=2938947 RepID=UPI00208E87AA|nr:DUF1249 domain-containing protein [Aliidiomarina quisquiliarum]
MNKKGYVTDLKELHSMAERNYAGLLRLLPEQVLPSAATVQRQGTEPEEPLWRIQVGEQLDFEISLGLQAPYTTEVIVRQLSEALQTDKITAKAYQFHQVEFAVRLYHDVRMAEITDYQGATQLTALGPGKQPKRGTKPDEKHQLGGLLADWVKLCIHHGRSALVWEYGNELPQA